MRFRSELIAVVALTVSLVTADDVLDESDAIKKIELLGGKVTRDETLPSRPVIGVDLHGSNRFNDKYTHLLSMFSDLKLLNLDSTKITVRSVDEIGKLKNLTDIFVYGTQITSEGLNELKELLPNTKFYEENADESHAIFELEQLGGRVLRNDMLLGHPVVEIHFVREGLDDTSMNLLKNFSKPDHTNSPAKLLHR